ncbi:MAG: YaiI/YqxD family protein [Proteobacteria bacterium]|nr:YaiI/YqxD family protein [Pseudomonadota bacterium]
MLIVFVDADGCPVKDEVYRVAQRYGFVVRVVANRPVNVPFSASVQAVRVGGGMDEADDWIAERAGAGDIVITADIPLAARCLPQGARVLGVKGREFTANSIGDAVASRELAQQLREMGVHTGGPAPMEKKDRSRFLSRLDEIAGAIRREHGAAAR